MTDSLSQNDSQKNIEINVHKAWDVNFWCDELSLRAEELKEIVKVVGPKVHDVRVYLAKKLLVAWPMAY